MGLWGFSVFVSGMLNTFSNNINFSVAIFQYYTQIEFVFYLIWDLGVIKPIFTLGMFFKTQPFRHCTAQNI